MQEKTLMTEDMTSALVLPERLPSAPALHSGTARTLQDVDEHLGKA
jgi:hypothetical protein